MEKYIKEKYIEKYTFLANFFQQYKIVKLVIQ